MDRLVKNGWWGGRERERVPGIGMIDAKTRW